MNGVVLCSHISHQHQEVILQYEKALAFNAVAQSDQEALQNIGCQAVNFNLLANVNHAFARGRAEHLFGLL